ncbi:MAG: hypothetical protein ABIJ12_10885, partial [bacterium]
MNLKPRHYTFIGLFLVIGLSMLVRVHLDIPTSKPTQDMYNYIDSLPEGSTIIFSFDHEASSLPEIRPIGLALLRHAFKKGHKLIGFALLAEGTVIGYRMMQNTAKEYNREYGSDWVYLGFKPQYIAAILSMGESFQRTFPEDYLGNQ